MASYDSLLKELNVQEEIEGRSDNIDLCRLIVTKFNHPFFSKILCITSSKIKEGGIQNYIHIFHLNQHSIGHLIYHN